MSISYQAKSSAVLSKQLKVQELVIDSNDSQLVVVNGGDVCVLIGEEVAKVELVLIRSGATLSALTDAQMIISDSTTFASGGDKKAIRLDTLAAVPADGSVVIKYIVAE
jgi:hypothetical protein